MLPSFDVQAFNAPVYNKILGLESDGVVSDWYALLGVDKFESDEAKIDQAMLRRFEQARRYQVGNYEAPAQRLIDELGRAYACLTDDETRRSYDNTLRDRRVADAFAEAPKDMLLNGLAEAKSVVPAVPRIAPVESAKSEVARQPAADETTCPQCGKPTSPRAAVCYQCGYKKPAKPKQDSNESKRGNVSTTGSSQGLVRQDLSPEQLLARLKEMRKLSTAANRAAGMWNAPKRSSHQVGPGEPGSRCRDCTKGLMQASDAYGLLESDVRGTQLFVESYARKLEALGRANFTWPLSEEAIRQVQQQMAEFRGTNIELYCRACATRIFRSPRVVS